MSASTVAIEWLAESIRTGEAITSEDMDAARGVASVCDPEDAAAVRSLICVVSMEQRDTWPTMPAPRTHAEQLARDASMRVANSPDPFPQRSRPVRAVLDAAWNERCGGPKSDRVESARIMRTATPEDRAYLMTLRGLGSR